MSAVEIIKESMPEWAAGSGSVAQTPVQLPAWPAKKCVIVRAESDNDDVIRISPHAGSASVGFALAAGERQEIYVDDASKVWVIADSSTQNYSWYAL